MQIQSFLTAFLLFAAITCNKNESDLADEKRLTLAYAQTQCADPWPASNDDNTTAQNVKKYLEQAGVSVFAVSVKRTSTQEAVCAACTCPSGKTIYVTVPDDEQTKEKLLNLKFQ